MKMKKKCLIIFTLLSMVLMTACDRTKIVNEQKYLQYQMNELSDEIIKAGENEDSDEILKSGENTETNEIIEADKDIIVADKETNNPSIIHEDGYQQATLEYFVNVDKDYTIDDITREVGTYNSITGSGVIHYVWKLDDGTSAHVYFSANDGKICRITIWGEKTELIYNRWDLIQNFLSGELMAYREGSDKGFYITDLPMDTGEWDEYRVGEMLDLDNDGEGEQIINGPYGGMFLDKLDDKVIVFAEGQGAALQLSYAYYEDAYWIVISDTTHSGRKMYTFTKYSGADTIVDSFELAAEYWEQDYYDENSKFTCRGKEITMEEFEQIIKEVKLNATK